MKADHMTKAEARATPHEFGVAANPYKSALTCVHCGLPRRHPIHTEESDA